MRKTIETPHYHMVPKEIGANAKFRVELLRSAGKNKKVQQDLVRMCKEDILFYVNAFCYTHDPRLISKGMRSNVPFVTYGYQDRAIIDIAECILNGRDFVCPKSRDMGASWIGLTVIEWFWHFYDGQSFGIVSRNQDYVDKRGDSKALFWKALDLETDVYTPNGPVKIKDIKIGDVVFGSGGKKCNVTNIIDHNTSKMYRITFDDGSNVDCSENHLWSVTDVATRHDAWLKDCPSPNLKTVETKDMFLDFKRVYGSKKRNVFRIPSSSAIEYDIDYRLEIPPYTLGALIGDGSLSKPSVEICGIDEEVFEKIKNELGDEFVLTKTGKCSVIISSNNKGLMQERLLSLGMRGMRSWEKHIPKKYLFSSKSDRYELLRGLMDTDGWVRSYKRKSGDQCICSYETTSESLANDICFLIKSLGGHTNPIKSYPRYYTYKGKRKEGRKAFRFTFTTPFNPFFIKRKADLYVERRIEYKKIVDIKQIKDAPSRCISVDSDDHLFLIDGFNLTHNCDFLHENQPQWLLPTGRHLGYDDPNRKSMHLRNADNGSTIDGESTTGDVFRGGRLTALFIDEFAAFETDAGFKVLNSTRDVTLCRGFNSTPQGSANAFYEVVHNTNCKHIRMHWSEHPDKAQGLYRSDKDTGKIELLDDFVGMVQVLRKGQAEEEWVMFPDNYPFLPDGKLRSPWYDNQYARCASPKEVAQELDIDFAGSDYAFFDPEFIQSLRREYARPPTLVGDIDYTRENLAPRQFRESDNGKLKLWINLEGDRMLPPDGRRYVIGADVSAGTGASNSVLTIADPESGEKVGVLRTPRMDPKDFARQCIAIAKYFNNAFLIWDASGPTGKIFTNVVIDSAYRYIYFRRNEKAIGRRISDQPGYFINGSGGKEELLTEYRADLAEHRFINRSDEGLKECLQFIRRPGGTVEHAGAANSQDPSGARTAHGDEVIADALASLVIRQKSSIKAGTKPEVPVGSLAWRNQMRKDRIMALTAVDGLGAGW